MRKHVTEKMKDEAGYSLVEVVAAIMILSLAIIPMVGMFDAGLRAVATGGNFDKARALANQELEDIRALPYSSPDPQVDGTANSAREIYPPASSPHSCSATLQSGITSCEVTTTFVRFDNAGEVDDPNARNMMRVEVTVKWGNGSYDAIGLISQETG